MDPLKKLAVLLDDKKLVQELWKLAEDEERHERWESEKKRRHEISLDGDEKVVTKIEYELATRKEVFFNNITKYDLYAAMSNLSVDEKRLIHLLYFQHWTERDVANLYGLSQKAINKRKIKVLLKIRKELENA